MRNSIFLALFVTWIAIFQATPVHAQVLEEHAMLKMDDGQWRASLVLFGADGEPAARYEGRETNHMVGDLWSVGTLELMLGDEPYVGFATLGYDPSQGRYVGTWVDSSSPQILQMQGSYDAETRTLVLFYETLGPDGEAQQRKNVMVYQDPNTRVFDSFLMTDGAWAPSMSILYERQD